MKCTTWIVVGCLVLGGITSQAASFDCGKAGTKIEKIICGDAEISKLDEELDTAYRAALKDEKQADVIRQAQKQWMKERNGCVDAVCVKYAYEERLSMLTSSAKVPKHDEYILVKKDLDESTDYLFHIVPDPKVCQLYQENLNYFAHRNIPMSCNRPIAPQLKNRIQEIEWEDLMPADYPELFRQVALFLSRGHDKSPEALRERAKLVSTKEYVFRRAKLSLSGKPLGQTDLYGEPDKSRKDYTGSFFIVQYGNNSADTNRPGIPCKPIRGNWPGDGHDSLDLFLVNKDMNEVINKLGTLNRGQHGEHMRLIDGKPYVEGILGDARIRLFRLSIENDVFLEMLCEYRFEMSCRLRGKETFDPNQPMCKPNLN